MNDSVYMSKACKYMDDGVIILPNKRDMASESSSLNGIV